MGTECGSAGHAGLGEGVPAHGRGWRWALSLGRFMSWRWNPLMPPHHFQSRNWEPLVPRQALQPSRAAGCHGNKKGRDGQLQLQQTWNFSHLSPAMGNKDLASGEAASSWGRQGHKGSGHVLPLFSTCCGGFQAGVTAGLCRDREQAGGQGSLHLFICGRGLGMSKSRGASGLRCGICSFYKLVSLSYHCARHGQGKYPLSAFQIHCWD